MEEISCRVIQDILPLYVDEVVSSDTKLLVREHLEKCESCRRDAENMRRNIGAADLENFEREQAETLKNLKRSLKQKRIKTAVISVILAVVLASAVYCVLLLPTWYVPYDEEHIKVFEEDGNVYVEYRDIEISGYYSIETEKPSADGDMKTIRIIYFKQNLWSRYVEPLLSKESQVRYCLGEANDLQSVYYGEVPLKRENGIDSYENAISKVITDSAPIWER